MGKGGFHLSHIHPSLGDIQPGNELFFQFQLQEIQHFFPLFQDFLQKFDFALCEKAFPVGLLGGPQSTVESAAVIVKSRPVGVEGLSLLGPVEPGKIQGLLKYHRKRLVAPLVGIVGPSFHRRGKGYLHSLVPHGNPHVLPLGPGLKPVRLDGRIPLQHLEKIPLQIQSSLRSPFPNSFGKGPRRKGQGQPHTQA